ncbi:hypothetical protein ACE6H2_023578 [Prunus campanulata]
MMSTAKNVHYFFMISLSNAGNYLQYEFEHLIILFLYFSILIASYSGVDVEIYCIWDHIKFIYLV